MQQSNARTPVTSSPSDDHELFVHQPPEFDTAGSWLSSFLRNPVRTVTRAVKKVIREVTDTVSYVVDTAIEAGRTIVRPVVKVTKKLVGGVVNTSNQNQEDDAPNLGPQLQNENPNFEDGDGDATHNALVVGQVFSYQLNADTFHDPEGETITFSIDGDLPPGLTFNAATRTISGTPRPFSDLSDPDADFEAAYTVNVIGTDPHGATMNDTMTFMVRYPNQAPRIRHQLADQELNVGQSITLSMKRHMVDPEGEPLQFSVDNLPDGMTLKPLSGRLSGQPTEAFDDIVTITARDPSGLTEIMTFRLTVTSTEDMSIDRQLAGGAQSASWGFAMNPPYSSDNGEEHFPAQIEIV